MNTTETLLLWIIRHRWVLLAVAASMLAAAAGPAINLPFDRSIEHLFAPDDPLLAPFAKLKRVFGRNEIVMVVYEDSNLMSEDGRDRLQHVTRQIQQTSGVADVLSLATIPALLSQSTGGRAEDLREMFERYTHGPDDQTAAVVTMLEPDDESPRPRTQVLSDLATIAQDLPRGSVIGEPVLVEQGIAHLQQDGGRLMWWSSGLLAVTLLLTLRSIRWVTVAIAVVVWCIVLTRATAAMVGLELSIVNSMLPAVITVIGVAAVMHLAMRFAAVRDQFDSNAVALRRAMTLVIGPIALACFTDAVGFGALLIAAVQPIQDFGWMMIAGSLLVLPAILMILPCIVRTGDPATTTSLSNTRTNSHSSLPTDRTRLPRRWAVVSTVIFVSGVIAVAIGAARLQVQTDFTKNFRADSSVSRAYEFVEDRLGGAGVWDVIVPAPPRLDADYLDRVLQLESDLHEAAPRLTKTLSLADAVRALSGDAWHDHTLRPAAVVGSVSAMRFLMPTFYRALYNVDPDQSDQHYIRIMLRAPERMTANEKLAMIAKVRRTVKQAFPDAQLTGYYVLLANLVTSLNRDQWYTLLVAAVGIGLIIAVAFRSVLLATTAIFVNALPVLVLFGVMGWLGIPLNMGGAMSAAVSLGLAVDATIHFLTAYNRARDRSDDAHTAIAAARATVSRPVVLATLACVVGFAALVTSEFVPTAHFGVLVSVTLLGGLVGNLVLLPWILSLLVLGFGEHHRLKW